jgi:hypothetical protein
MKVIKKIKKCITWLFSADVRNAINEGKSYKEVKAIVDAEVRK